MNRQYEIGQQIWEATWEATQAYVACPDCAGTARVRVMLPDDTIVSVECQGCCKGYEGSDGRIMVYDRQPLAQLVTITGVEIENDKIEWRTDRSYRVTEDHLFESEAHALVAAQAMAAAADREERERVNSKENPLKSWAWNAHYHRKCIRDAEKQISYHTARLAVAKVKAKEKVSA